MYSRIPSNGENRTESVSTAAADALVDRVSRSSEFANSPRSQEVLRYLCRSALNNPEEKITEYQIGVSVFGWKPDQDTGSDTNVRVQISQLRRKLDHYFASEGKEEPVAVRIPRGSYSPVFEHRGPAGPGQSPRPAASSERRFTFKLLLLTNLLTAALAALILVPLARVGVPAGESGSTPALDQFWRIFRGRPAQVVLSDGNLLLLSEMMGRNVSLPEYRSDFNPAGVARANVSEPSLRSLGDRVLITHMTSLQDALVLASLTSLLSRYHVPVSSISARDFQIPQPDNLILLGHARLNPWVDLFDDRLNFQYQFDWKNRRGQIVNRSPKPGEQAVYTAQYGSRGYCVVACLPKPIGEGSAMLIFGSDLSSLQAGGRFVSDDKWIARLYARMGLHPKDAPPYIEVLLQAKLLDSVAPVFDVLAYRVKSAEPVQMRTNP